MNHQGTSRIETERLLLRPFAHADAEAMYRNWCSDPAVTKYLTWPLHKSPADSSEILKGWVDSYDKPDFYLWAIVLKERNEPIGSISVVHQSDRTGEVGFGYCIGSPWWHMGYISEAFSAVIDFFFMQTDVNRIAAWHDPNNPNSGKVMEKCGLIFEGISRGADKNNQGICDLSRYALLREDWEIRREIAAINALPCVFNGFISVPELRDGELYLVCMEKKPAIPEKKYVPSYEFAICKGGEKIGDIGLRIGYTDGLYYGGQIGYSIDEAHRGKGYAARACRLLLPVAKAHGMEKLLITNSAANDASRRVCEKLGAVLLRQAALPAWHELYLEGQRRENIFCWDIRKEE